MPFSSFSCPHFHFTFFFSLEGGWDENGDYCKPHRGFFLSVLSVSSCTSCKEDTITMVPCWRPFRSFLVFWKFKRESQVASMLAKSFKLSPICLPQYTYSKCYATPSSRLPESCWLFTLFTIPPVYILLLHTPDHCLQYLAPRFSGLLCLENSWAISPRILLNWKRRSIN